jgi:hypothetical protein
MVAPGGRYRQLQKGCVADRPQQHSQTSRHSQIRLPAPDSATGPVHLSGPPGSGVIVNRSRAGAGIVSERTGTCPGSTKRVRACVPSQ